MTLEFWIESATAKKTKQKFTKTKLFNPSELKI